MSTIGTKRRIGDSKADYKKRLSESASVKTMETLARLEDKKLTPSVTKTPLATSPEDQRQREAVAIASKVVCLNPEMCKKLVTTLEDKKMEKKTKKRIKIEVIVKEIGHFIIEKSKQMERFRLILILIN